MADALGLGAGPLMRMWRRRFLGEILTLTLAALGRGVARAQSLVSPFRPLARPVVIPLEDLATPWRARSFVADGVTLASAAAPNQPIRVTGMVVRTVAGNDQPETFAAICVRCPHEGCDVEFLRDANQLPPEVKGEIGRPVTGSVYVCPCHNSTFAASDGSRLAGPAPRGLYRFKVTGVTAAAVEIAEVEEDVLIFV